EVLPSHPSDYDVPIVRDRADRVRTRSQLRPHRTCERVGSAGCRGGPEDLTREKEERPRSLRRQATFDPFRLAADEVKGAFEPKRFEPPRGSWAHVSEVVVAVGDDGA